jgi:hypothetical protein
MKNQHIVTVSLRCPGLSNRLIAMVIPNVAADQVEEQISEAKRISRWLEQPIQATHVYSELHEAHAYAKSINDEADRQLAVWRHRVYGEPMPA